MSKRKISVVNEEKELKNINSLSNVLKSKYHLKYKNESQKKLVESIKNNDVTVCVGPAGTGKSLCTIFAALELLKDHGDIYSRILLLKSVTQLKDEMLPALPGDAMEKMLYQNMSFFDTLIKLLGERATGDLINTGIIKFDVIGSMRGRDISNSVIILDECQNISHDNLKTILTRISDNTKIIILGDPQQIDIRNKKDSSLSKFINKVKRNPNTGVGVVEFNEEDIVRHRLTGYFINLFKEDVVEDIITELPQKNNIFKKILKYFSW